MQSVKRNSLILAVFVMVGCDKFEVKRTLPSGGGLYATVAVPVSKDAWTLCVGPSPKVECSRAEALAYIYRGRRGDVAWSSPNVLTITQDGGEIRKSPPAILHISGQNVRVEFIYTP